MKYFKLVLILCLLFGIYGCSKNNQQNEVLITEADALEIKDNAVFIHHKDDNIIVDYYLSNYNGFKLLANIGLEKTYSEATQELLISMDNVSLECLEKLGKLQSEEVYDKATELLNSSNKAKLHYTITFQNDSIIEEAKEWNGENGDSYPDYNLIIHSDFKVK